MHVKRATFFIYFDYDLAGNAAVNTLSFVCLLTTYGLQKNDEIMKFVDGPILRLVSPSRDWSLQSGKAVYRRSRVFWRLELCRIC